MIRRFKNMLAHFKAEISKFATYTGHLESKNVRLEARIKAMETEMREHIPSGVETREDMERVSKDSP